MTCPPTPAQAGRVAAIAKVRFRDVRIERRMHWRYVTLATSVAVWTALTAGQAAAASSPAVTLVLDASNASRGILYAHERIAVSPGPAHPRVPEVDSRRTRTDRPAQRPRGIADFGRRQGAGLAARSGRPLRVSRHGAPGRADARRRFRRSPQRTRRRDVVSIVGRRELEPRLALQGRRSTRTTTFSSHRSNCRPDGSTPPRCAIR